VPYVNDNPRPSKALGLILASKRATIPTEHSLPSSTIFFARAG
jgi:hypothetical protein